MDDRVPKPPDTDPRGGARVKAMTEHQMIDLGMLGERTADKLNELVARVDKMEPNVAAIPEIKAMLKVALAPQIIPVYVRISAPLAACALLIIAFAASLYLARVASAFDPSVRSPSVQAR